MFFYVINQRLAVNIARKSRISVWQGPPGTGKTHTAAVLASILAVKEKGYVVITAPSNFAANEIADHVHRVGCAAFPNQVKVIRVYSKTLETISKQRNNCMKSSSSFKILHEEVRNSQRWLKNENVQAILERRF